MTRADCFLYYTRKRGYEWCFAGVFFPIENEETEVKQFSFGDNSPDGILQNETRQAYNTEYKKLSELRRG